eukprot:14173776-Heterocapsa_arctica.AAC.1
MGHRDSALYVLELNRHGHCWYEDCGMHHRDQQGDLRCGDTCHPVSMFCLPTTSRSPFLKGITIEVAEFNSSLP